MSVTGKLYFLLIRSFYQIISLHVLHFTVVTMEVTTGTNYRVIPGKHKNSKVIVHEDYCLLVDKATKNAQNEVVFYLKCQNSDCAAKATIRAGTLTMSEKQRHTCIEDSAVNRHKIVAQELLAKMKERAANEGTPYFVSEQNLTPSLIIITNNILVLHACMR